MNRHQKRAAESYGRKNRHIDALINADTRHRSAMIDRNITEILQNTIPGRFAIANRFKKHWVSKVLGIRFTAEQIGSGQYGIKKMNYGVWLRKKKLGEFIA